MTIGTFEYARMRRHTSNPSMSGRPMSRTTSRTGWRRSSPTASSPDLSQTTRQPSCCSRYALTRRPIASSSSTSSRTPPVAVALMAVFWLPDGFDLHELCRGVRLVVEDDPETRAKRRDRGEPDRALDAGCGVDRDRLGRAVGLADREVRAGDRGDDAAVDPPVLRPGRRLEDDLRADHPGAEELVRDRFRDRHAAAGQPERRVQYDERDGEEHE